MKGSEKYPLPSSRGLGDFPARIWIFFPATGFEAGPYTGKHPPAELHLQPGTWVSWEKILELP